MEKVGIAPRPTPHCHGCRSAFDASRTARRAPAERMPSLFIKILEVDEGGLVEPDGHLLLQAFSVRILPSLRKSRSAFSSGCAFRVASALRAIRLSRGYDADDVAAFTDAVTPNIGHPYSVVTS